MKSFIRLMVVSFCLTLQGGIASSMETIDNRAQETILKLLSLKFHSDGQALADKIEAIKEEDTFKNLRKEDVHKAVEKLQLTNNQASQQGVSVYLPSNNAEESYQSYLIAAAYYPRELDPQRLLFTQICDLEHIHLQLAYALHYAHPLAASMLEDIAESCDLPPTHKLNQVLNHKESIKENLISYFIPINTAHTHYKVDKLGLLSSDCDEERRIEHFNTLTDIIEKGYRKK